MNTISIKKEKEDLHLERLKIKDKKVKKSMSKAKSTDYDVFRIHKRFGVIHLLGILIFVNILWFVAYLSGEEIFWWVLTTNILLMLFWRYVIFKSLEDYTEHKKFDQTIEKEGLTNYGNKDSQLLALQIKQLQREIKKLKRGKGNKKSI